MNKTTVFHTCVAILLIVTLVSCGHDTLQSLETSFSDEPISDNSNTDVDTIEPTQNESASTPKYSKATNVIVDHTLSADDAENLKFQKIQTAIDYVTSRTEGPCDVLITVEPGQYDETIDFTGIDCEDKSSFVLTARNPVMEDYADDEIGAGDLSEHCYLVNKTDKTTPCGTEITSSCYDYSCDYNYISYFKEAITYGGEKEANIEVNGFETHYFVFSSTYDINTKSHSAIIGNNTWYELKNPDKIDEIYKGCLNCSISNMFFNTYFTLSLGMSQSDYLKVFGNKFYRQGGDDSCDDAFNPANSMYAEIHHNDFINPKDLSNKKGFNPDSVRDGVTTFTRCNSETDDEKENWKSLSDHFMGTDGLTIHSKYFCGAKIYKNIFANQAFRYGPEKDDGDQIDMKTMQCNIPNHINDNVFKNPDGENMGFHLGPKNFWIYNNTFEESGNVAISFQAGQECNDYCEYCGCHLVCDTTSTKPPCPGYDSASCGCSETFTYDSTIHTPHFSQDQTNRDVYETLCTEIYPKEMDATNMSDFLIFNNVFKSSKNRAIQIKHTSDATSTCTLYEVPNNDELSGAEDVFKRSVHDISIFNNTFYQNRGDAIYINWIFDYNKISDAQAEPYYEDTIKIINNIFSDNCYSAIDGLSGDLDDASTLECNSANYDSNNLVDYSWTGYPQIAITDSNYMDVTTGPWSTKYVEIKNNIFDGGGIRMWYKHYQASDFNFDSITNNLMGDPLLDSDYIPQDPTLVVDKGIPWSDFLDPDILDNITSQDFYGNSRQSGSYYDLGAVEQQQ